jgi:hypothetical protein
MCATTATPAGALDRPSPHLVGLVSWLVPGAGHLWLGRSRTGLVALGALLSLFFVGLGLGGRLFPFVPSQPLVALAALADVGAGAPYFLAWAMGWGGGHVTLPTYEHGNTFLITAGLLNALVVLDAYDVAAGRK